MSSKEIRLPQRALWDDHQWASCLFLIELKERKDCLPQQKVTKGGFQIMKQRRAICSEILVKINPPYRNKIPYFQPVIEIVRKGGWTGEAKLQILVIILARESRIKIENWARIKTNKIKRSASTKKQNPKLNSQKITLQTQASQKKKINKRNKKTKKLVSGRPPQFWNRLGKVTECTTLQKLTFIPAN